MFYPYCGYSVSDAYLWQTGNCCNLQTARDLANVAYAYNHIPYNIWSMLNVYQQPKPKSGREVWKDLSDCWIVIAAKSGPLKLLELELK